MQHFDMVKSRHGDTQMALQAATKSGAHVEKFGDESDNINFELLQLQAT